MRIGQLSERVIIEEKTVGVDSPGGLEETWVERATVWAKVVRQVPGANAEAIYSGVVRAGAVYKITLRPLSWLTVEHRLRRGINYLELLNIAAIDDSNRRSLVLVCESGVNRG